MIRIYENIAKYIFYTETSREFPGTTKKKNPAWDKKTGRIGEHPSGSGGGSGSGSGGGGTSYYLLYKPNRTHDWGIDTEFLKNIAAADPNPTLVVYAEKVWVHQHQLREFRHATRKTIRTMLVPFGLK